VDAQLALLCQQPLSAARPGKQEQILLANILRWLGRELPDVSSPRIFRWPIPGLVQADAAQAGSSLRAFLQQAASDQPFANLVVMGETILDALPLELSSPDLGWQLYVTASATEMLNLPVLKKEAWLKLIPLHAAISR
jgi:hypothetical protein